MENFAVHVQLVIWRYLYIYIYIYACMDVIYIYIYSLWHISIYRYIDIYINYCGTFIYWRVYGLEIIVLEISRKLAMDTLYLEMVVKDEKMAMDFKAKAKKSGSTRDLRGRKTLLEFYSDYSTSFITRKHYWSFILTMLLPSSQKNITVVLF